ncbi:MAG: hypothetical protein H6835_16200 [Planctomycetes bacterium]|nr:hypothetical protein [Planctomycetota bacterium]
MERIAIGTVLALVGLVGTAAAQQVSLSVRATTPLTASLDVGGTLANQVQAVGALPTSGSVYAQTPPTPASVLGCRAWFWWNLQPCSAQDPGRAVASCGFAGMLEYNAGAATGSVGAHELVFDVTATAPRSVWLDIDVTAWVVGASAATTWEVDVGDDGSIEAQLGSGHVQVLRNVGVIPLPIRVRCSAAMAVPNPTWSTGASMDGDITIAVTPENRVDIQQTVIGCGALPLVCEPVFAHQGVQLQPVGIGPLAVVVLGLQQQPWVFTNLFGSGCVVMPSLDVLLLVDGPFDLPIPASVRPFTCHAQIVHAMPWFGGYTLATTEAYRIFAH